MCSDGDNESSFNLPKSLRAAIATGFTSTFKERSIVV